MSLRRRVPALVIVVIALAGGLPWAAPAAAAGLGPGSVTLSVLDVSPTTPTASETAVALSVTFRVRNNTAQNLTGITITGERATPLESQTALDAAMAHPAPPDPGLVSPMKTPPLVVDLAAGSTQDAVFTTTTGIPTSAGVCLCRNAIYPLYFTATVDVDGTPVTLATTQTYIPSFDQGGVAKLQVGWVWPLLDVPHRLTSATTFVDDKLAVEVSPGGRLDRALTVLENVAATVPMTVITDPDLLDELQVMAAGPYHVQQRPGGPTTVGTGSVDAATWLDRLRTVLANNPDTELDLTPYGDPDVEGLQRNGFTWTGALPTDMQARVTTALGGLTPPSDIAWPVNATLSKDTLKTLVNQGTQTVIVSNKTLPNVMGSSTSQNALAALTTTSGPATAGVTNTSIEAWAAKVFTHDGDGQAYLPQFVSQVALHAVTSVDQQHYVLIAPPRLELNVDPNVAENAIRDTATTSWSTPVPLRLATHSLQAKATSTVKTQSVPPFPDELVAALQSVQRSLSGLETLFLDADRANEIGSLPTAVQLAASSSLVPDATATINYATRLDAVISDLRNGVHLVTPATRRYTLTSTNSSIPITIENTFAVPAQVNISADAVGGVPGFYAKPIVSRVIRAHSTVQVRLPTHFDRTGRIEINVYLSTPTDLPLGDPITLSVRSTALGTIGVVITAVAGVVLVIALLVRAIRRWQQRARQQARAKA